MTKWDAYISKEMQLQNHSSTFILKNKSLFSATSILSLSPMAYNTTASLDKLTCNDYVDFGKYRDRFGRFTWSNKESNNLDEKLKAFKKDDNEEFRLVQNLTLGEAYFNQLMRLRNQLVNQTLRERKSWPHCWYLQCPKTWMKNSNWLTKVLDVVDRANRKICDTLLPYNEDKPASSYV